MIKIKKRYEQEIEEYQQRLEEIERENIEQK